MPKQATSLQAISKKVEKDFGTIHNESHLLTYFFDLATKDKSILNFLFEESIAYNDFKEFISRHPIKPFAAEYRNYDEFREEVKTIYLSYIMTFIPEKTDQNDYNLWFFSAHLSRMNPDRSFPCSFELVTCKGSRVQDVFDAMQKRSDRYLLAKIEKFSPMIDDSTMDVLDMCVKKYKSEK